MAVAMSGRVATVQLKVFQITKVIPEMNNKQDEGLVNGSAPKN